MADESSDEGLIYDAISGLLDVMIKRRIAPTEAERLLMHAVHIWMQAQYPMTEWRHYEVDGYAFIIRRLANGKLEIGRAPRDL